jgi:hypothetical protein
MKLLPSQADIWHVEKRLYPSSRLKYCRFYHVIIMDESKPAAVGKVFLDTTCIWYSLHSEART